VWRNTTQPQTLAMEAPVYESFFKTVRDVNRALPADRRLRVWLGDPPIDWAAADVKAAAYLADRDRHFADVVEREIYARGRKALLVSGGRHLARNNASRSSTTTWGRRTPMPSDGWRSGPALALPSSAAPGSARSIPRCGIRRRA
jgi:hypothetical protein